MIFLKLSLTFSGDEGDRTPDLLTASQTLSQLSYAPKNALILNHLSFLVKKILRRNWMGSNFYSGNKYSVLNAVKCCFRLCFYLLSIKFHDLEDSSNKKPSAKLLRRAEIYFFCSAKNCVKVFPPTPQLSVSFSLMST